MSGYNFSKTSLDKLETCDPLLQRIFKEAIKRSPIDFGIAEGYRSVERQKLLFESGMTKIDGITKKGKHNYNPSKAVDIYAFVNGKASWNEKYLCFIAGVVFSVAEDWQVKIRWGGNWDMDGEIVTDQSFIDLPHFELI